VWRFLIQYQGWHGGISRFHTVTLACVELLLWLEGQSGMDGAEACSKRVIETRLYTDVILVEGNQQHLPISSSSVVSILLLSFVMIFIYISYYYYCKLMSITFGST